MNTGKYCLKGNMHRNVREWVQDSWHSNYNGAPTDGSAWEGDGSERVIRSGTGSLSADALRSAVRLNVTQSRSGSDIGFRLLRSP